MFSTSTALKESIQMSLEQKLRAALDLELCPAIEELVYRCISNQMDLPMNVYSV